MDRGLLAVLITVLVVAASVAIYYTVFSRQPTATGEVYTTSTETRGLVKIRIGLIPVIDVFPVLVAEREGLFRRAGVDVELVFFGSARDRDTAIVSGSVDMAIHDPVGSLILVSRNVSIKIVGFLCCGDERDSNVFFRLLAAPGSTVDIHNISSVAVSRNTIIEYVAWRMLREAGVDPSRVEFIDVPSITNRYQLLIEGRVQAAVLPDPWGSLAVASGARELYRHRDLVVIIARTDLLSDPRGREAVKKVLEAIDTAVDLYNRDPQRYRDIIEERLFIPQQLRGNYTVVWRTHITQIPRELIDQISQWLLERGLIEKRIGYQDVVASLGE